MSVRSFNKLHDLYFDSFWKNFILNSEKILITFSFLFPGGIIDSTR